MAYERYPRNTDQRGDQYRQQGPQDGGRDYGSGRDGGYSTARDDAATARGGEGRGGYGSRDYGNQRYDQRGGRDGDRSRGGPYPDAGRERGVGGDRGGYGDRSADRGGSPEYHGSYASDGHRFEDVGRYRDADDDNRRDRPRGGADRQSSGARPQGQDPDDRGFFQRAGDEVRSWFGDEDAERRRDMDQRYDEREDRSGRHQQGGGAHHDHDYHSWRAGQIAALDRDYDEYRQENRSRFENEFSSWRANRQGQRDQLTRISEHMEVVGSDGEHVGTVDKVRGDRVLLTRNDVDAGGRHHSFSSSWITAVDGKVTVNRSAADAKKHWQDEDRNQAMFGYGDNGGERKGDQAQSSAQGSTGQGPTGQGLTGQGSSAQASSTAKTY